MNQITRFHDAASDGIDEANGALHKAMLADDRAYFRASTSVESIEGWKLRIPTWSRVADTGCIVEPPMGARDYPSGFTDLCRDRGIETLRFYLPGPPSLHESWSAAFARNEEIAMGCSLGHEEDMSWPEEVSVDRLNASSDPIKTALFESDEKRPDGKPSLAADFVLMERAKIEAGYMRGYLIAYRGMAAGCFGISLDQPGLVRLKNLFLAPRYRGRGLARLAIRFAANLGVRNERHMLGAFAIKAHGTQKLYEGCGLHVVGSQTEMTARRSLLAKGER